MLAEFSIGEGSDFSTRHNAARYTIATCWQLTEKRGKQNCGAFLDDADPH